MRRLVLVGLLSTALTGCASSMQNTPRQEATWDIMRACDHFPGVTIDRVEPDGKYWVKQNNEGNWRLFQQCVAEHRLDASKAQHAKAEGKDIVHSAYFIKLPPRDGLRLQENPPAVTEFKVDQPVTFFFMLHKSGQERMGKFKWYKPDGTLAAQQDRVLRDGTTTATRTWFTQTLPSINVQDVGTWSLELTIGEQAIGRYPYTVSQQ